MPSLLSPFDIVKEKYQTFLSVPKKYRPDGLKTTRDFAKHFCIPAGTLMMWEQEPGFLTEVFSQSRAIIARNMAEIVEALVERAKSGSVAAIKLALEVGGVHHDTVEIQHTKQDDQLILVLPEGMTMPSLPLLGAGKPHGDAVEGEIVGPAHIDDDMDFILGVTGAEEKVLEATTLPKLNLQSPWESEM